MPGGPGQAGPQDIQGDGPRILAQPQRVPAAGEAADGTAAAPGGSKKKLWIIVAAAAIAVIAIVGVVVGVTAHNSDNSPEAKVQKTITVYTDALKSGNLDALRAVTCGAQHDFYQKISADQFASVYKTSQDQKSIPQVKSVDAIQITGDAALAQATVYTAADPAKTSARTFDLRNEGGSWKVCDPQNGH